jgi:hypothetical protein
MSAYFEQVMILIINILGAMGSIAIVLVFLFRVYSHWEKINMIDKMTDEPVFRGGTETQGKIITREKACKERPKPRNNK